jgi:tryptophanyl-tRNA synthetase
MQERRKELAAHPEKITEIIREGSRKARAIAAQTLAEVNEAMKL